MPRLAHRFKYVGAMFGRIQQSLLATPGFNMFMVT
jgi:ATP-dependent Lon protease